MNCNKAGSLVCKGVVMQEGEMEKINALTTREFSEDEVYCFEVLLCDNEIDRDNERFDRETLQELAELFVGKSGICDHEAKSCNQQARIYDAWVEDFPGKQNSLGRPYCALMARAYMVKTESNKDLILEIEAGIKKEVSVGCSVRRKICSVCGKEAGNCSHIPGEEYDGERCYLQLSKAQDAYEWSFVAVPAQRNAGVFGRKEFAAEKAIQKIYSACSEGGAVELQKEEVREVEQVIKNLLEDCGEYRRQVRKDVMKKAFLAEGIDQKKERELCKMLDNMNVSQMKLFAKLIGGKKDSLEKSQFPNVAERLSAEDREFMI